MEDETKYVIQHECTIQYEYLTLIQEIDKTVDSTSHILIYTRFNVLF